MRGFRPDGWRARERVEHQKYEIFKLNREQRMVIKSSFEDSKNCGSVGGGNKSCHKDGSSRPGGCQGYFYRRIVDTSGQH